MRACEEALGYPRDRPTRQRVHLGQPFSRLKVRGSHIQRLDELYQESGAVVDRAFRRALGMARIAEDQWIGCELVVLYRSYRDGVNAKVKYDATYRTKNNTTITGDVVQVRNGNVTRNDRWTVGYVRIRHIIELQLVDGEVTIIDADWFVCVHDRAAGNQQKLAPRNYALRNRLFPASWIQSKCYLAPQWEAVDNPEFYYLIQCWEASNNTIKY